MNGAEIEPNSAYLINDSGTLIWMRAKARAVSVEGWWVCTDAAGMERMKPAHRFVCRASECPPSGHDNKDSRPIQRTPEG